MILNLIDNAVKYTPTNGEINILCAQQGSLYTVTIRDSGEGISPELQPRVFERFFRADKVRSRSESGGGGAGLGLTISLWIPPAPRGQPAITSSNFRGTPLSLSLPKQP